MIFIDVGLCWWYSSQEKHHITGVPRCRTGEVNVMDPSFKVYAPWRDPVLLDEFPGRTQMLSFLQKLLGGKSKRHAGEKAFRQLPQNKMDKWQVRKKWCSLLAVGSPWMKIILTGYINQQWWFEWGWTINCFGYMWYHGPWLYHKPVGSWDQHVVELQTNHTQPYLECLPHMLHCVAFDVQPYFDARLSGEWFVGSIKENHMGVYGNKRHAVGSVNNIYNIIDCYWSYLFFFGGGPCACDFFCMCVLSIRHDTYIHVYPG